MSRATLKPIVSKIREAIIKGVAGKLEKYGFDENGILVIEKPLSEFDETIRNNLIALFEAKHIDSQEKYVDYIHNTSRTFMHILICFKLMEKRGIMGALLERVIGTDIYNEIIPDFVNINPMAFDEFVSKYQNEIMVLASKDNNEENDEYYQFIYLMEVLTREMSKEVPLLFKEYEYNLIQPEYEDLRVILQAVSIIETNEYDEDDFLGWIYQYWVDTNEVEVAMAGEYRQTSFANNVYAFVMSMLKKEQAEFGEFYTPRWIVQNIVNKCIEESKKDKALSIEKIKLLDPACGAGNFLVYSFDAFMAKYEEEHPDWTLSERICSILQNNIFGADIQREPLQITALNLWIKAKKYAVDAKINSLNLYNVNVLMANSLYHWEKEEEYYQITLFDTPETILEKRYSSEDIGRLLSNRNFETHNNAVKFFKQKFEIIVMNPPFVDARKMNPTTLNFLKEFYPDNARNLFSAFIGRTLSLLNRKGILGFISSDTFFSISSFSNIREKLLGKRILEVDILGGGVFDGPTVTASIMFIKNESNKNNEILVKKWDGMKLETIESLKQEKLREIAGYPFIFEVTDRFRNIFKNKLIGDCTEFEVRKGIVTAGNDKYLKYIWEVPQNMIGTQFILYNKEHDAYVSDIKYVLDWRIDTRGKILSSSSARCAYLLDNYDEVLEKYNFKAGVAYKLVGNFRSCLLDNNAAFDVGTPAILMDNCDYQKYVLALMNSKLYVFLSHLLNPTVNNTPGDVRRLPFVYPDKADKDELDYMTSRLLLNIERSKRFEQNSTLFECSEIKYGFESGAKSITEAYNLYLEDIKKIRKDMESLQDNIDKKIYEIYDLSAKDIIYLEEQVFSYYISQVIEPISIEEAIIRFVRELIKLSIKNQNRLYTSTEIIYILQQCIEDNFEEIEGYKIIEEIESLCKSELYSLVVSGVKVGTQKYEVYGQGSKDEKEPYIQMKVIAGKGKNKEIILWHLSDFLIEFEENKCYTMQNEIRRLASEVYIPKLQRAKEKLQLDSYSISERKVLEKDVELYGECVKTLENWKVVE